VYSEVGRGTTVKVYLPRTNQVEEPRTIVEPSATLGGDETVLLVEDEPGVRMPVPAGRAATPIWMEGAPRENERHATERLGWHRQRGPDPTVS
jgi:hypothetical protein